MIQPVDQAAGQPTLLTTRLAELGRLDASPDVDATLRRVSAAAQELLPGVIGVSFTVRSQGGVFSYGASNDVTTRFDEAQESGGEGPCLTALESGDRVSVPDVARETRWPLWLAVAREHRVDTVLAIPVSREPTLLAAMNVYARPACALEGPTVTTVLNAVAAHATVLFSNLVTYGRAVVRADQLAEAMASRATIEQAKGALMAMLGVDDGAAWDYLVKLSQAQNVKVRDLAKNVVDQAAHGRATSLRPTGGS